MNTNDAQIRIYRRVTPISHHRSTGVCVCVGWEWGGGALNALITRGCDVARRTTVRLGPGRRLKDKR